MANVTQRGSTTVGRRWARRSLSAAGAELFSHRSNVGAGTALALPHSSAAKTALDARPHLLLAPPSRDAAAALPGDSSCRLAEVKRKKPCTPIPSNCTK